MYMHMENNKVLAVLNATIDKLGVPVTKICLRANLNYRSVSKMLRGETELTISVLESICSVLGVSIILANEIGKVFPLSPQINKNIPKVAYKSKQVPIKQIADSYFDTAGRQKAFTLYGNKFDAEITVESLIDLIQQEFPMYDSITDKALFNSENKEFTEQFLRDNKLFVKIHH